jgi:predicted oxidoreductase
MERLKLSENLTFSRISQGLWRLNEWRMSSQKLVHFVEEALEMEVTTFDIADIYGEYTCEVHFGKVFKLKPSLRKRMEIVTKCGIKIKCDKFPMRKIGHYDTGYDHIIASAEQSLKNLQTDYLDVLLIHRPDPLMNPAETARAFDDLHRAGKVRYFGVSNFNPMQFDMLQRHCTQRLVTNQVEFSPWCLEHIQNNNLEFFQKEGIIPMAWSPLAGGRLFDPRDIRGERLVMELEEVAAETGAYGIELVAYAWILKHPAKFIPIVGSGKIERLKRAVDALEVALTTEQWFRILVASQGHPMP